MVIAMAIENGFKLPSEFPFLEGNPIKRHKFMRELLK